MRPVPGEPRISIGVAALTWLGIYAVALAVSLAVLGISGNLDTPRDALPTWMLLVSVTALWIPTLIALRVVSNRYGTGRFRDDYQLRFRRSDLLGIPLGVGCQLILIELVYIPLRAWFPSTFGRDDVEQVARDMFDRAEGVWRWLFVVVVVVGAPLVEESLYRGLILRSLDSRLHDVLAVIVGALWFAIAHQQGVQLPGLFAFGLVLGVCLQRSGRLGLSVVTHAAFNATTVVMLLAGTSLWS